VPTPPVPQPAQQPATAAPTQSASNATVPASTEDLLREGVGGRGRGEEGAGRAAVGNGSLNGPGDDYLEEVRRWISRYKKYPPDALDKKQEGVATLGFVIDRDGKVLDAWIEKTSGNPLLDQATMEMIHAASPVPKPPDRYKGATLRLFMPVNYQIGLFDKLFH
jgi:TonB family protein